MKQIKCKVKDDTVNIPKYKTKGSAGMDLSAHTYCFISDLNTEYEFPFIMHPRQRILVKTGLFIETPEGYEAQVRPRSGLALKNGISIVNTPGTIDSDYRGEIGVILINTSEEYFTIEKGDRIAQLVFNKVEQFELIQEDKLSDTERGLGGYASTGIK